MKMESKKRKRTPNFTAEEKLRLVRLLREEGQCIISKVTSHDATTNKEKESAWQNITAIHNSSGYYKRQMDGLKKLWTKLKSEAKTFKAASHLSTTGTGGGPGKHFNDPVMELVVELTGRASTGIMKVDDCDAEITTDEPDKPKVSPTPAPAPAAAAAALASTVEDNLDAHFDYEFLNDNTDEEDFIFVFENESPNKPKKYKTGDEKKVKENWAKRQPKIANINERTENINKQHESSNSFAAERLKAEKEKINLIKQKINQNCELHEIAMNNEKLKNQLLKMLIKKVSAGTIGTEEAVCCLIPNHNM